MRCEQKTGGRWGLQSFSALTEQRLQAHPLCCTEKGQGQSQDQEGRGQVKWARDETISNH